MIFSLEDSAVLQSTHPVDKASMSPITPQGQITRCCHKSYSFPGPDGMSSLPVICVRELESMDTSVNAGITKFQYV